MRVEGEEEDSDTFKALKIGCFTISVSSSFLYSSGVFSGKKQGNWQVSYIWGRWGKKKEKKRVADTILDALEALYKRYMGIIKNPI